MKGSREPLVEGQKQKRLAPVVDQAPDAERGILGSCLISAAHIDRILEAVPVEYFANPVHQTILLCLRDLRRCGHPVDLISVTNALETSGDLAKCGGPGYITDLFSFVPTATNWEYYAHLLKVTWRARRKKAIAELLLSGDKTVAEASAELAEIQEDEISGGKGAGLTIRTAREILEMTFDEKDNYFGDRLIAAGQTLSVVGPGGLGKSRFLTHLAVSMITGRPFLDIDTHAKGQRWLFIQAENNNRRLHSDLKRMLLGLRLFEDEVTLIQESLFIHTFETDADTFLDVENPEAAARIEAVIKELQPHFVVFDPLNCMTALDLNADRDMRLVTSQISRIVKKGNPDRVPIIVHHSLTGKAGAARAIGFDKASYGRNSKVLYNWCRSQINLAPRDAEDNTLLLMTCGKSNNGKPFSDMGVVYDERKGVYMADPDFDADAFREAVGGEKAPRAMVIKPADVAALFENTIPRTELARKIEAAFGCKQRRAYTAIYEAVEAEVIKQTTKGKWNVVYSHP